jgi:hypothetical protein
VTDTVIAMTFQDRQTCLPAAVASAAAVPECVDAAFADLVYADDNWVRDEFDAIIAESFDEPPRYNRRPRRWWRPRRPAHQRFPCDEETELPDGIGTSGDGGRQRAPPR